MTLAPALLSILACPEDRGPLYYVPAEDVLFNPRLRRTYEVRDGIPIMLIDESTTVDDARFDELQAIVERDGIEPTFDA